MQKLKSLLNSNHETHALSHLQQRSACVYVGFNFFRKCNGQNGQARRTASACQILSKSVESRPRYSDFSVFQDGACHHLGFSKLQFFTGRDVQDSQAAQPCQISSKSLKPRRLVIFRLSKMAAAAILDFF